MADHYVRLTCSCEEAVQHLTQTLERWGFRVVRGFDLQSAMAVLPGECPCPYHGTAQCTCNYTVLLVYGSDAAGHVTLLPQRIAVHSFHDQTWLSFLSNWEEREESSDPLAMAQAVRLTRGLVAAVSEISA
ncbi:MAG TPA: hypothetical protein EYP04_11750 [Anaerolineae bacterium]|nr:hypothetical protein [Anaerolineae bacterium]HIQ06718.1 hypothetical protein [Anaerolineae bacterium]